VIIESLVESDVENWGEARTRVVEALKRDSVVVSFVTKVFIDIGNRIAKVVRQRQASNLRRRSLIDFESISLTARTRCRLSVVTEAFHIYPVTAYLPLARLRPMSGPRGPTRSKAPP
jgi:hypothetical protein